MMCPVCKRDLAPTLSICLTCGAMMNDSVRQELQSKVASVAQPANFEFAAKPIAKNDPIPAAAPTPAEKKSAVRMETSDLSVQKTSPTLAEFRTKSATMPDWRLQLQNTVRQRNGRNLVRDAPADAIASRANTQTNGANALKMEYVAEPAPPEPMSLKVANALKRIEESRRAFLPEIEKKASANPAALKNFPFNVVSRSDEFPTKTAGSITEPGAAVARPQLVSSLRIEKKRFDTNKLVPPSEVARLASSFETMDEVVNKPRQPLKEDWSTKFEIKKTQVEFEPLTPDLSAVYDVVTDEIDDLAPVAMRFNAGLFDLIIGGFSSLILLSPFLFASDGWISLPGFLTFAAIMSVVMFIYLTASISYFGRSVGMRFFSLELVNADGSDFPTLHQSAVSSSIYLLSLISGGLGFLPMLFNEEKRAAHDIASGTILIREL